MSINRVFLSGNLTRDPDVMATNSGITVLTFGIAVNDRKKSDMGEWENYPNFFDCVVYGNRADALKSYLEKGSRVAVEGRLRQQRWEKDGQKRSRIEVVVEELCMFFDKGRGAASEPQTGVYEEDVPF